MTQQLPQRRLGDRSVGAIGLGAMPMSVREVNDEERGIATVIRALELGVTLIDTADAYSISEDDFGANELLIAKALKEYAAGGRRGPGGDQGRAHQVRHRLGVWTARRRTSAAPASLPSSASASSGSTSSSTTGPTRSTPYDETLGGLKALLDEGLIAQAGISNADPGQIRRAREVIGDGFTAVQNQFSPAFRSSEPEIALCEELGLTFLPGARWAGCPTRATSATSGSATPTWPRGTTSARSRSASRGSSSLSPALVPIPGASRPESVDRLGRRDVPGARRRGPGAPVAEATAGPTARRSEICRAAGGSSYRG